jgi:mannosidase alpha-like ER degradation enhancer 1
VNLVSVPRVLVSSSPPSSLTLTQATRDPFYLDVGERVLNDIIARARVPCGLTGIKDLRTNNRDDRMESFVLSETLKVACFLFSRLHHLHCWYPTQYLYLLFDEKNAIHYDDSNYVFTTEGHILSLGREQLNSTLSTHRKVPPEQLSCPVYLPPMTGYGSKNRTGLIQGVRSHVDIDYSRELVALFPEKKEEILWSPSGWCERPKVDIPVGHRSLMIFFGVLTVDSVIRLHPVTGWQNHRGRREPWFRQNQCGV